LITSPTLTVCASCGEGYHGDTCLPNVCNCNNGVASVVPKCKVHQTEQCALCNEGWYWDEELCVPEVNECDAVPCGAGQTCHDPSFKTVGDYHCGCGSGKRGTKKQGGVATCADLEGIFGTRHAVTIGDKVNANYYDTGYFYSATVTATGTDAITNDATVSVEFTDDPNGSVVLPAYAVIPQTELAAETVVWARQTEGDPWEKSRVIFLQTSGIYLAAQGAVQSYVPDTFYTIRLYQKLDKGDRAWCSNGDYRWFECEKFDVTETTTDYRYSVVYDDGRVYELDGHEVILIHHYTHIDLDDPTQNQYLSAKDVIGLMNQCSREHVCNAKKYQKCDDTDVTCQNGGTVVDDPRHPTLGGCKCSCIGGYTGSLCETPPPP